jgi:hypothetical protein
LNFWWVVGGNDVSVYDAFVSAPGKGTAFNESFWFRSPFPQHDWFFASNVPGVWKGPMGDPASDPTLLPPTHIFTQ